MQRVGLTVLLWIGVIALAVGLWMFLNAPDTPADGREPLAGAQMTQRSSVARAAGPAIDSQVVFLYYEDIGAAAAFYGDVLGLEQTYEAPNAAIFRTSASSYVGLVDQDDGYHRVAAEKPVMVSLVTDGVDEWHARLRDAGVEILSEPADSERAPVRAFLARDPGGYTVEFFRWLDR